MKMTLHPEINVLYIELHEGEHDQTLEVDINTYIDIDKGGRVLGLEILNAREFLAKLEKEGGSVTLPDVIREPKAIKSIYLHAESSA
jgi:uncharacterized protein YuzE